MSSAVRSDALQLATEFIRVFTLEAVLRAQVDESTKSHVLDPQTLADNMQSLMEDFA